MDLANRHATPYSMAWLPREVRQRNGPSLIISSPSPPSALDVLHSDTRLLLWHLSHSLLPFLCLRPVVQQGQDELVTSLGFGGNSLYTPEQPGTHRRPARNGGLVAPSRDWM